MPHLKGHKFSCLLFIHFVIWNFLTIMYGVFLHSTVNAGTSWNFWWYSSYNAYLAQVFEMNTVQLKTLLIHTTTTCFWQFTRHDCLMFQHSNTEKVPVIMPTRADRLHFPVLQELINPTPWSRQKNIEYTALCYILSQYFLICFNYLE